jgi:predicted dehydrogenase
MVGAGGVAERHARCLLAMDGVDIVAVADVDGGRACALADHCGAVATSKPTAVTGRDDVDAVYICVPPFAHGEPEMLALDAGLPFFVEKPVARDLAVAEEVAAAVRRHDALTATGYHWRYYDTVEQAAALAAERPVRLATASWMDKVPPVGWWPYRGGSGGQFVEQVTHVLDLLRVLVGEVRTVHALGARFATGEGDVDDVAAATLGFVNGALGSVVATSLLNAKHRTGVELFGEGFVLGLDEDALVVNDGGTEERFAPTVDGRSACDHAFIAAVRGGDRGQIRAPYQEALRTHRLACALADASRQGTTIEVAPDERSPSPDERHRG